MERSISVKTPPALLLFILITSLISSPFALAEIYKWVDENGKVHFTDKPPQRAKQKPTVVDIKKKKIVNKVKLPQVASLKPIKNGFNTETRTVLLESVSLNFQGDIEVEDAIGATYRYTGKGKIKADRLRQSDKAPATPFHCKKAGKLTLSNAKYIIEMGELAKPFKEAFEEAGYSIAGKKTFVRQQVSGNDLSLAASITDIRLLHCGSRSAPSLRTFTQNASYMKIEWTVFDNLERKIVFNTSTEGREDSFKKSARFNGAAVSARQAFRQAVDNLLADQKFVDLLSSRQTLDTGFKDSGASLMDISIARGSQNSTFISQTADIEKATVTIRTPGGHGSGFLISAPGYILTNHHVVGDNHEVLVIHNGKEQHAAVIRSHPGRDVALLKLNQPITTKPLNIESGQVSLGAEIYVVGTPLDEKLEFSISRGIISAKRERDNRKYYQTDAAVNPGNSGGPVFNSSGNVIGITVSGLFTTQGASVNINYVIPVLDALDALDIDKNL